MNTLMYLDNNSNCKEKGYRGTLHAHFFYVIHLVNLKKDKIYRMVFSVKKILTCKTIVIKTN